MWYVYILRSRKDWKLYIGSTNDLKRRLKQHNSGEVTATFYRKPFILESYIAVKEESVARSLEQYLKAGSGHAFLNKRLLAKESSPAFEADRKEAKQAHSDHTTLKLPMAGHNSYIGAKFVWQAIIANCFNLSIFYLLRQCSLKNLSMSWSCFYS